MVKDFCCGQDEEVIQHFNSLQDQLALESPPVTAVRVVREPRTGTGRGIAYVEMAAKGAVSGALRLLQVPPPPPPPPLPTSFLPDPRWLGRGRSPESCPVLAVTQVQRWPAGRQDAQHNWRVLLYGMSPHSQVSLCLEGVGIMAIMAAAVPAGAGMCSR